MSAVPEKLPEATETSIQPRERDSFRLLLHGDVERGHPFTIEVDGAPITVYEGETVAGALIAHGVRVCRVTARGSRPHGLYCGIGICYECLMTIDGRPNTRACMTYVAPGMKVRTQVGWGEPPDWRGTQT